MCYVVSWSTTQSLSTPFFFIQAFSLDGHGWTGVELSSLKNLRKKRGVAPSQLAQSGSWVDGVGVVWVMVWAWAWAWDEILSHSLYEVLGRSEVVRSGTRYLVGWEVGRKEEGGRLSTWIITTLRFPLVFAHRSFPKSHVAFRSLSYRMKIFSPSASPVKDMWPGHGTVKRICSMIISLASSLKDNEPRRNLQTLCLVIAQVTLSHVLLSPYCKPLFPSVPPPNQTSLRLPATKRIG